MDNEKLGMFIMLGGGIAGSALLLYFLKLKEMITKAQLIMILVAVGIIGVVAALHFTGILKKLLMGEGSLGAKKENLPVEGVQAVKDYFNMYYHEKVKIPVETIYAENNIVGGVVIRPDLSGNYTKWYNFAVDLSKNLDRLRGGDVQLYPYTGDESYLQKKQKLILTKKRPETELEQMYSYLKEIDEGVAQAVMLNKVFGGDKQQTQTQPQAPAQPQVAPQPIQPQEEQKGFWWNRRRARPPQVVGAEEEE